MLKVDLDDSMGWLFVGVVVGGAFWGVSCIQMWSYFHQFPKDPIYTKAFVLAVWISDTLHQILVSHALYTYVISNYNNVIFLLLHVWSLGGQIVVNGITAFLVQCFFAHRVWTLSSGNIPLTATIMTLVVATFSLDMVYGIRVVIEKFNKRNVIDQKLSLALNVVAVTADILIAVSMCWLLTQRRTGHKRTNDVLNKLIVYSLSTGTLISIASIALLVANTVWPHSFAYIFFFFILGRLYNNSLLASLNARTSIRSDLASSTVASSIAKSSTTPSGNRLPSIRFASSSETMHDTVGDDVEFQSYGVSALSVATEKRVQHIV